MRKSTRRVDAAIQLLALSAGLFAATAAAAIDFSNVTATALDRQGASDYRFDAVWTDFNSDGCPDPFIFGHADPATSRLWLNRCDGSGSFTLTDNAQVRYYINPPLAPMGAGWMSVLDIDGDGREDFWLRHADTMAARYLNGSVAGSFQPRFADKQNGCDDACVFADINGDGTLDIVHPDRRIVDIVSGRVWHQGTSKRGEAIVFDVNGDGWPEIVQPAAGGYWRNRIGKLDFVTTAIPGGQSAVAADFDGDGRLDLFTTDPDGDSNARVHLLRNDPAQGFVDVTAASGLADLPVTAWWSGYSNRVAADLDNDGRPDLVLAGYGHATPVQVWRNLGGMRFARVSVDLGPVGQGSEGAKARVAIADYDLDGRLDLVKTQAGSNIGLWRNTTASTGRWMQARVRGPGRNSDGVGTALRWREPGSGRLLAHEVVQLGQEHPRKVLHAGLGSVQRVDLEVQFPHAGPTWWYRDLVSNQAIVVYADGCLLERWAPGQGWPLAAPAQCDRRGEAAATHLPAGADTAAPRPRSRAREGAASTAFAGPQLLHAALLAASTSATAAAAQRIELVRNGAVGEQVAVSVGIPLPPGALTDVRQLRILDEQGEELPAHVTETLRWHHKDGSLRAVRVQLRTELKGERRRLRFELAPAQRDPGDAWPWRDGLVNGQDGVRVPGVLAVLSPEWLTASGVAGPQVPAGRASAAYDAYFERQFQWAGDLPVDDPIAFLFDRPSVLFKQYVRTGKVEYLRAAIASYRHYMAHLVRDAEANEPGCGGGWKIGEINPCDVKFVYIEPILLALALTGDDADHDAALIAKMARLWDIGGWSGIRGAYTRPEQIFTERHTGLGLVALVSAYELTGEQRYRDSVKRRIGWLHDHLRNNPDGLGDEGCWRHSWQAHEGDDYDAATDLRGCSPWMSENLIDGLWHAWQIDQDPRIAAMIVDFGRWLERYGWIDTDAMSQAGHDWRSDCSGADGQIAWYFAGAQATPARLIEIQESEGWYSDSHTVQLALPVAAARYFETEPDQQRALDRRLRRIEASYARACAASAATPRRFNWNHRGAGTVWWLRQQAPATP